MLFTSALNGQRKCMHMFVCVTPALNGRILVILGDGNDDR